MLTNQYIGLCFDFALDYRNCDHDFDSGDDIQNIHCRPLILLLSTLLSTRIFYNNPTKTLFEVKMPYSF